MKRTRMQRLFGLFLWLVSGVALGASAAAEGQTTPSDEPPVGKPTVAVQREGRLLVLRYGTPGEDAQSEPESEPNSPPEFAIYQGQKKIASGQFEYG